MRARSILANGRTRVQQLREAQFQFAGATWCSASAQGLDGDVAYNVAARRHDDACRRGGRTRSSRRTAPSPDHHRAGSARSAAKLANPRVEGNEQLVDITTAAGDAVTLAIDQSTHLPSRVISMSDNANMGDVAIVTTFSDYEDVDGVKLPRRLTTKMDNYLQFDLQVAKNALDGDVADLAAPAGVKSAPAPERRRRWS